MPELPDQRLAELLLDVAQPLTDGIRLPEDFDVYHASVTLAAAVWNAARLPSEEQRQKVLDTIVEALVKHMNCPAGEAGQTVQRVCQRAWNCGRLAQQWLLQDLQVKHTGGRQVE